MIISYALASPGMQFALARADRLGRQLAGGLGGGLGLGAGGRLLLAHALALVARLQVGREARAQLAEAALPLLVLLHGPAALDVVVAERDVRAALADQRVVHVVEARLVQVGAALPVDVVAQEEHEVGLQRQVVDLVRHRLLAVRAPLGDARAVAGVAQEHDAHLAVLCPLGRAAAAHHVRGRLRPRAGPPATAAAASAAAGKITRKIGLTSEPPHHAEGKGGTVEHVPRVEVEAERVAEVLGEERPAEREHDLPPLAW